MATPVWPANLPQKPLLDSFTHAPQENKVSFQPDVGPPIERRRGTAKMHEYKVEFPPINAEELAVFETWFEDDLADGVLHYLWAHPVTGVTYKWKIDSYSVGRHGNGGHVLKIALNQLPGAAV